MLVWLSKNFSEQIWSGSGTCGHCLCCFFFNLQLEKCVALYESELQCEYGKVKLWRNNTTKLNLISLVINALQLSQLSFFNLCSYVADNTCVVNFSSIFFYWFNWMLLIWDWIGLFMSMQINVLAGSTHWRNFECKHFISLNDRANSSICLLLYIWICMVSVLRPT